MFSGKVYGIRIYDAHNSWRWYGDDLIFEPSRSFSYEELVKITIKSSFFFGEKSPISK